MYSYIFSLVLVVFTLLFDMIEVKVPEMVSDNAIFIIAIFALSSLILSFIKRNWLVFFLLLYSILLLAPFISEDLMYLIGRDRLQIVYILAPAIYSGFAIMLLFAPIIVIGIAGIVMIGVLYGLAFIAPEIASRLNFNLFGQFADFTVLGDIAIIALIVSIVIISLKSLFKKSKVDGFILGAILAFVGSYHAIVDSLWIQLFSFIVIFILTTSIFVV